MYNYKSSCKNNLVINHQWMAPIMDEICSLFINFSSKLVTVTKCNHMYDKNLDPP